MFVVAVVESPSGRDWGPANAAKCKTHLSAKAEKTINDQCGGAREQG